LISAVEPGGKAEAAGLRGGDRRNAVRSGNTIIYLGGDIITKIGSVAITNMASVFEALQNTKPGQKVRVEYMRDGRPGQTDVELVLRPERYMD
jgi:S1-C subfamily serine protease